MCSLQEPGLIRWSSYQRMAILPPQPQHPLCVSIYSIQIQYSLTELLIFTAELVSCCAIPFSTQNSHNVVFRCWLCVWLGDLKFNQQKLLALKSVILDINTLSSGQLRNWLGNAYDSIELAYFQQHYCFSSCQHWIWSTTLYYNLEEWLWWQRKSWNVAWKITPELVVCHKKMNIEKQINIFQWEKDRKCKNLQNQRTLLKPERKRTTKSIRRSRPCSSQFILPVSIQGRSHMSCCPTMPPCVKLHINHNPSCVKW